MSNVIEMDPRANEPHFVLAVLCVPCSHRWIGVTHHTTSLFKLECPSCGAQESFASILPPEYLNQFGKEEKK